MPIKEKKRKNRRKNMCLMQIPNDKSLKTFLVHWTEKLERFYLYIHTTENWLCVYAIQKIKKWAPKKKRRKRTKWRGLIVSTCYLNQGTVVWVNFPYSRAEVTRSCDRKKSHKSKKSASFQQQFYIWNYQKWCLMFWSIKCKSICVIYLHNNKRL